MNKSCIQYKCVCGGNIVEYVDGDGFYVECTNSECNTPFSKREYELHQKVIVLGELRNYRGVNYYCYDNNFYIVVASLQNGVICNSYLTEEDIKLFIEDIYNE